MSEVDETELWVAVQDMQDRVLMMAPFDIVMHVLMLSGGIRAHIFQQVCNGNQAEYVNSLNFYGPFEGIEGVRITRAVLNEAIGQQH